MNKQRIARVRKMEEDFKLVRETIDNMEVALDAFEAARRRMERLSEYQESGRWLRDFEADERGELPEEMERGVLSEDGLSGLLDDIALLRARLATYTD